MILMLRIGTYSIGIHYGYFNIGLINPRIALGGKKLPAQFLNQ